MLTPFILLRSYLIHTRVPVLFMRDPTPEVDAAGESHCFVSSDAGGARRSRALCVRVATPDGVRHVS